MILNIKTGLFLMNCQRKLGDIEIMDIQTLEGKLYKAYIGRKI